MRKRSLRKPRPSTTLDQPQADGRALPSSFPERGWLAPTDPGYPGDTISPARNPYPLTRAQKLRLAGLAGSVYAFLTAARNLNAYTYTFKSDDTPAKVASEYGTDVLTLLTANADIQSRQALEQQLKELVRQHQYWDALALARRIISEHPLSPQASALRGQLPRLEELARQSPAPAA